MIMKSNKDSKIYLMNLSGEYSFIKTDIEKSILNVARSGRYVMGENVKDFEKEFLYM